MQLAVLTSTISRKAGGLFVSVRHLHGELSKEVPTQVYSLEDQYTAQDMSAWQDLQVNIFPHLGPSRLSYSPRLNQALNHAQPDIVHVHGLWQGPSIASMRYHRKSNRPHIVSPRGMLDPWAHQHSGWKKKLAGHLFEYNHLRSSACMHALCESEEASIRKMGLAGPVCIIPNAVHLPEIKQRKAPDSSAIRKLLFLGRLHPKKGLLNAIKAWKDATSANRAAQWQFVIAGWDQNGHEAELQNLCRELDISHEKISVGDLQAEVSEEEHPSVIFTGPAFGEEKESLLRLADAFILPSFSEGLPMSVLEAWSYSLPVLMTDQCNLPEGFAADAAYRICPDPKSISNGLQDLFAAPRDTLLTMGTRGLHLVESRFTWDQVAGQMKEVYEWILGGGSPPSSVRVL